MTETELKIYLTQLEEGYKQLKHHASYSEYLKHRNSWGKIKLEKKAFTEYYWYWKANFETEIKRVKDKLYYMRIKNQQIF